MTKVENTFCGLDRGGIATDDRINNQEDYHS